MNRFYKNNTFLMILSVVIAVILWTYVVYEVNPIYDTWIAEVPVKCINTSTLFSDGSLIITGDNEDILKGGYYVSVKVKGKRTAVSSASAKSISCTLDMITVTKTGNYTLKPETTTDIQGLDIVRTDPSSINIKVENVEQRDIKIDIKKIGKPGGNYTLEDLKASNETVKITGAVSVINKVYAATASLDCEHLLEDDSEKSCVINFYDSHGNLLDSGEFEKTVEYVKLTFSLCTVKDVTLIMTPKYKDEIKTNRYGKNVSLSIVGDDKADESGGIEITTKIKGTKSSIEKYTQSKRTVYTEDIDISEINSETVLEKIKAEELSNGVSYVTVPEFSVKAAITNK